MQQRLFGVGIICQPIASALAVGTLATLASAGSYVPGTPEATVEAIEAQLEQIQNPRGTQRFVPGNAWFGADGTPKSFTFSYAPDGTQINSEFDGTASGSTLFAVMNAQFNDDAAQWQAAIENAFTQWANVSGLEFTQVFDPARSDNADDGAMFSTANGATNERGDIRIGMKTFPGGAGGLCSVGLRELGGDDYGEIVLDASEDWAVLSGGSLRFLTNCIAREIGIAVGLNVACPANGTKLMEPVLPPSTNFVGPRLDDIRAAHRLYGDTSWVNTGGTLDENGNRGTALPFDEIELLQQVQMFTVSLDKNTETDYYAFTLPEGGGEVSITVNPVLPPIYGDPIYEDGIFNAGVCDPGPVINTSELQDIQIEIQDTAGIPVAGGTVNDNGIGEAESIVGLDIPLAGTYYLVVSSAGGADEVQMYGLIAQVQSGLSPNERIIHMDEILPEINFQAFGVRGDVNPTGNNVVIANIEAGLPWLDHAAFQGTSIQNVTWGGTDPSTTLVTDHATAVTGTAAGQPDSDPGDEFTGIAPGVNVVGSSIATTIDEFSGFTASDRALLFSLFALTEPNYMTQDLGLPRAASVLNLSWGASGGDLTGESQFSRYIDAVVSKRGVLAVIAAGNRGSIDDGNFCGEGDPEQVGGRFIGARTVAPPATAFNAFTVGAVSTYWRGTGGAGGAGDDTPVMASDKVAYFSSRGPIDSFDLSPDSLETVFNVRPGVHIVAQGTGLVIPSTQGDPRTEDACPYLGDWFRSQSLDLPWIDPDDLSPIDQSLLPNPDQQFFSVDLAEQPTGEPGPPPDPGGVQGTSFAAPIVAGVAALLQDVAIEKEMSINSLVLRSILMTGARKAPGWSNNGLPERVQMTRDGREIENEQIVGTLIAQNSTTQPLDYLQGAGVVNVLRSLQVYFGQLNIPADATPAEVAAIQADPQPQHFYPFLHDTPETNPTKPTVTRVDNFIVPDPFPGAPGDVNPQSVVTPDQGAVADSGPATPLQIAKALHEASKTAVVSPRMRSWADVDPVIGVPIPGEGGGLGDAPLDGNPFVPRPIDGPPPEPGGDWFEPAVKLDGPIEGGRIGWDIANLGLQNVPGPPPRGGRHGFIDYRIGPFNIPENEFGTVEVLTATLVWDRDVRFKNVNWRNSNFNPNPEIRSLELEDLSLELYQESGTENTPVFISDSRFNNVEHIYIPLPVTETPLYYILRVRWQDRDYDLTRINPIASVKYALSWRSDVFPDILEFQDSLANGESPPSTPVIPPVTPGTIVSLLTNLGATDADANYDASLDVNYDNILDVNDITRMIYIMKSQN